MFDIPDMAETRANPPIYDQLMALKPDGLSPNAWATRAGLSRAIWSDMRRHGNPTRPTLEKLLGVIGLGLADFEARIAPVRTEVRGTGLSPEQVDSAWEMPPGKVKPVPLLGTAFGGDWDELESIEMTELHLSEVLDFLARPPALAADEQAYAIEIVGDSMSPRFEPGERAYVSPKAAIRPGDDVVVQLIRTDGEPDSDTAREVTMVLIKRLVRRTGKTIELRQFNPDRTFEVPAERVRRMHRVRGRL